jgi:hypothetical protein
MNSCLNCSFLNEDILEMISSDPQWQLEEFHSQIARLGARLEEKRVPLKCQINRLCAPVLRLPPELSSEIFLAYLPLYWLKPQKDLVLTPLIFGSVCSDQRNQAWPMPWLWNRIVVYLDKCMSTISELLEEWLSQCGNYPLLIVAMVKYGTELDLMNPNVTTPIAIISSSQLCRFKADSGRQFRVNSQIWMVGEWLCYCDH